MARHRRDDQQLRAGLSTPSRAEMLELAERLAEHDLLVDRDRLACRRSSTVRSRIPACRAAPRHGRRHRAPRRRSAPSAYKRTDWRVVEPAGADIGEGAGTGEQRTLHFIGVVKHLNSPCWALGQLMWPSIASSRKRLHRCNAVNCVATIEAARHRTARPLRHGRTTARTPPPGKLGNLLMIWRFAAPLSRAYRRRRLVALLVAAAATLAIPDGFRRVIDRGFAAGGDIARDSALFHYLLMIVVRAGGRDRAALLLRVVARRARVADIRVAVQRQPAAPRSRASSRRTARPRSPRGSPPTRR